MGVKEIVKEILEKQWKKRYEKQLALRKISYDQWVREVEALRAVQAKTGVRDRKEENRAQEGAAQQGIVQRESVQQEMVQTDTCLRDVVLLVQQAGSLSDRALTEIADYFARHPQVQLLYGDEDLMLSDGTRVNPWYKPCWSPDLYCSYFYLGSVIAVRKALYNRVKAAADNRYKTEGNTFKGAEGEEEDCIVFASAAEIAGLVYGLVEAAGGFRKGCKAIGHVEYMLFHGDSDSIWQEYRRVSDECPPEGQRSGMSVTEGQSVVSVTVSIVIPSKDNPQVLGNCLQSLRLEKHPGVEVIVVDNGSSPENRAAAEANIAAIQQAAETNTAHKQQAIKTNISQIEQAANAAAVRIRYLYEPMEFNFSRMCNLGAEHAAGRYLLFLNDDMEMCDNDWLEVMVDKAAKEYVGAVGLKLYYPDSVRMQHAGIVNLPVGPVHKLQFMEDDKEYYFGRNRGCVNCVAVTGACLMIEKSKFYEAGGFEEKLRVAYNDVALGFALQELGYQNVVIHDRYAWHHESLSRGNDDTREKLRRLEQERELLYKLHPAFRGEDPYYPAGLNRQGLDSRVVPGYVTAKNTVQPGSWKPFSGKNWENSRGESAAKVHGSAKLRWDACLMVRVESTGPAVIQGYSVVLGDNNACYEKYLVLLPENGERIWYMKLEGQYRQDLEENIPDQVNVALGGFCVSRQKEQLPVGNYRIAVLAANRITGCMLLNESGKYLTIEGK